MARRSPMWLAGELAGFKVASRGLTYSRAENTTDFNVDCILCREGLGALSLVGGRLLPVGVLAKSREC